MTDYQMLVGGEFVDAMANRRLPVVDPFTREEFASIPDATTEDVQNAVSVASRTFDGGWSSTSGIARAQLMNRLADLLDERAEVMGQLESRDNGKLISETTQQVRFAARIYRFFAGYADKLYGRTIPMDRVDVFDYTLRQPVGVAALITAWNSPMQLLANKLAPALAAGCTVVIKPSEHASVSTMELARITVEAGFPPGVINVVSGAVECGVALTTSAGVDTISFTGSVPTGQAIAAAASQSLVPVTLELGGKSPNIVFEDADLDRAVTGALAGIFSAGGQTCIAGSRMLVHESVYREMVEGVRDRANRIRLGDPRDRRTQMGPVANEPQYDRIRAMVDLGRASGARLVTNDAPLDDSSLGRGLFIRPTVFADVDNSSRLAQEEIFGPVLSMIPFRNEDEAVALANETSFGLASGIWTQSLQRAHRVANRIVAGTVWVNTYRLSGAQAPFGGVKKSGHGRERGEEALDEYLRTKNVMIDLAADLADPFAASEG